jgi:hypothetical protein
VQKSVQQRRKERELTRENRIALDCGALSSVISAIRTFYTNAEVSQKALIETMIGAAIWYIPKPKNAWTGKISRRALEKLHPDAEGEPGRLSEEHVYPRKMAAKELLTQANLESGVVEKLFREKYGTLHYITPEENKAVIRFQKSNVFTTSERAYQQAGIVLISVDRNDLKAIKDRDRVTIERYLAET